MAEGSSAKGVFRRPLQFIGLGREFISSMSLFSIEERS